MRGARVYAGFGLLGLGMVAYAALQLAGSGQHAVVDALAGVGFLLAAAGWVRAQAGRSHDLLVGGLAAVGIAGLDLLPSGASSGRALVAGLFTDAGLLTIAVSAIVWAAAPRRAGGALVGVRVGAGLLAAAASLWTVGNVISPSPWLFGNLPVLAGGALVAWRLGTPGDDVKRGERRAVHRAVGEAAGAFMASRGPREPT